MSNDAADVTPDRPQSFAALCPSRRAMLAAAGGLTVAALLSACGDQYSGLTVPQVNDAKGDGSADAGTGGGETSADAGTGGSLLTTVDKVPVGGGKVVDGVLVMQPTEGKFRAFEAACPHQGVQVSPPKDGKITCPAHGAQFALDGSVTNGPAKSDLKRVKIKIKKGKIRRA